MKRTWLFVLALLLVLLLGAFWIQRPTPPRFRSIQSLATPPYSRLSYDHLAPRPFEGGQVWLTLEAGTNSSVHYLFDLEQRKVTGELLEAAPVLVGAGGSQVLCVQREARKNSLWAQARVGIEDLLGEKLCPWKWDPRLPHDYVLESYWWLDLTSNVAQLLGRIPQNPGTGSIVTPAPDFRKAFAASLAVRGEVFIFDFAGSPLRRITVNGWALGWWDNQTLLVQDPSSDFALLDVVSGRVAPLLQATEVSVWLKEHDLPHHSQSMDAFTRWNGREYDVFLAANPRSKLSKNSFLLKLDRPAGGLSLVAAKFKFEGSENLDISQQAYVFSGGLDSGQLKNGVFVRHLATGRETTLVAPDSLNYSSLPNLRGTNVIYVRTNELWQIGINGANPVRLFPPADR